MRFGRYLGLCLVLMIGLFSRRGWSAGKEFLAKPGEPVVPDQLIVRLNFGADIDGVIASIMPQAVHRLVSSGRNTYLLRLPPGNQAVISKLLAAHPQVQFVEPNRIFHTAVLPPNDSYLTQQWALVNTHALQAWSYFPDHYLTAAATGSNRVKVALIDTGVDCTHPDFMNAGGTSTDSAQGGQLLWAQSEAIAATTIPAPACPWQDDIGHGTHTAGLLAAATNNAAGVAAIGYPLQIIVYKAFDSNATASEADLVTAIGDAVTAGAQVISMSLAGPGYSQALQQAIDSAWQHNVLVVAASGNNSDNLLTYPGDANHALGVAATDSNNVGASVSSFGNWVKIAAPGVGILSTLPTYGSGFGINYGLLTGTSMAAPQVAAVAGLLSMANPGLSVAAIAQRIQQTAQTPNTGWDQFIGYGVVDAAAALNGTLRPATQGSLVGQVVDTASLPIAAAQVNAAGQTFTTASDGLFRIVNVSPGTYSITVTADGESSVNLNAAVVAGADTMLTIPMGVSLGAFAGFVTYNGVAVAGAVVEAVSGGLILGTGITDASGAYAVYIPAGTYTVTASAPNYLNTTSSSEVLTGGGTVAVNLSLSALGNLTGMVIDANGVSVPDAHIGFDSGTFSGGAATGVNGTYSTFGLPAGTYTVTASASGYKNVVVNNVSVTNNVSTVVNLQFPTGISLTSGLLGYWPFDEGSGTVTADRSGRGRDIALSNTSWTAGRFNSGLSFDGSSSVGTSPSIPFANTFSISAWVNPAVTTQVPNARIAETQYTNGLSLGTDSTGSRYKFIVNSGTGSTGTCASSFGCAEGGALTAGWRLVAGTYDGATAILYLDGVKIASDTATPPADTSLPLFLGQGFSGFAAWNGTLDDVHLYNRALTATEIAALFGQENAPSLSLTKVADAATVSAGTAIGYTLTVTNAGPGTATAATLNDSLPTGPGIGWSISPTYIGPGTCTIVSQVLTCNFGNLTAGTATAHVTSLTSTASCGLYQNTATVSASNASGMQSAAPITVLCPSLTVVKTHAGAFTQGQPGVNYFVTVGNNPASAPTAGKVTVTEIVPAGLMLASMAGDGWTCPELGNTCFRNDPLNPGASYPAIVVTVAVSPGAPPLVTNQVSVSGGGSADASAGDLTAISAFTCDLNGDQATDVVDVQIVINEALGVILPVHDLNHDGVVNGADVQKMIAAVLGLGCPY